MNVLIAWDQFIFFKINTGLANPVLDLLVPIFRNAPTWIPLYVFFAAFLICNFGRKGLFLIGFAIVAIALSDQLSSSLIKPLVHRLRPCIDANLAGHVRLLLSSCGAGFSFPSSHAVNHFTLAIFVISVMPKQIVWVKPIMLIWASLVAFSQVYVGVHYPLDVISGAVFGSVIGWLIASLSKGLFHIDLEEEMSE